MVTEIQFDTSALSNLLQSEVSHHEFHQAIARWAGRVVINQPSFLQCRWNRDVEQVRLFFNRMKELGFDRFEVGVPIRNQKRIEIAGRAAERGTPTLAGMRVSTNLDVTEAEHRRTVEEARAQFDTFREEDRALFQRFIDLAPERKQMGHGAAARFVDFALAFIEPRSAIVDHCLGTRVGVRNEALREEMARTPHRFRTHMLLAGYAAVNALGAYLTSAHTPDFPWLKREPDNHMDALVAGAAAHADILVSDDENMRARLAFLCERNLCFFRSVGLGEFLSAGSP
jgi:hypothetical protein